MNFMVEEYQLEKEARKRRIAEYEKLVHEYALEHSRKVMKELVQERHQQNLTQKEIANRTGISAPNIARLEGGSGVPTLVVLQKYAAALGKRIEITVCDE